MLDHVDSSEPVGDPLADLPCDIALPDDWENFFHATGLVSGQYVDRRSVPRFFFRARGVLEDSQGLQVVFTTDISRSGFGFVHSRQILPLEKVSVWLPRGVRLHLSVTRCLRIQDSCYICGAVITGKEEGRSFTDVALESAAELADGEPTPERPPRT